MKVAILIVIIPVAIMFSVIGWLIFKNKIDFRENGMEYIGNKVSINAGIVIKETNKGGYVRKASGVLLVLCGVFMIVLPVIML